MISERQYIKDKLYDFFTEMLGENGAADIQVIWGNGNGTRPAAPFLLLEFRSTVTPGMPDYSMVVAGEKQHITQHTRRNMTMYGFGERAIDVLETIKVLLAADIWVDKLRSMNLVIPQTMETLESPQYGETAIENGASFDFDLTYLRVIEHDPGYIEEVDVQRKPERIIR